MPNQIKDLNKDQAEITLSTLHLLHSILNKNFGFDKTDISDMQHHCLHLHGIIQNTFILKNNILFKQQTDNLLLAIPNVLAKGIILKLHSTQGLHFNSTHLQSQLKKLIYTKNLKDLCKQIEAQCPVCLLSKINMWFRTESSV